MISHRKAKSNKRRQKKWKATCLKGRKLLFQRGARWYRTHGDHYTFCVIQTGLLPNPRDTTIDLPKGKWPESVKSLGDGWIAVNRNPRDWASGATEYTKINGAMRGPRKDKYKVRAYSSYIAKLTSDCVCLVRKFGISFDPLACSPTTAEEVAKLDHLEPYIADLANCKQPFEPHNLPDIEVKF